MNWKRGKHFKTFSAAPMLGTTVDDDEEDDDEDDDVAIDDDDDDDVVSGDNETDADDDNDDNDPDEAATDSGINDDEVLTVADDSAVCANTRCFLDASKLSSSLCGGTFHGRLDMLLP